MSITDGNTKDKGKQDLTIDVTNDTTAATPLTLDV